MKRFIIFLFAKSLLLFVFAYMALGQGHMPKDLPLCTNVQYNAQSQRRLTIEEKSRFKDVIGYSIAIQMRLKNTSNTEIYYLSSSLENRPLGYRWEKIDGDTDWSFTPNTRGRIGLPGVELTGVGYEWRLLSPQATIDADFFSASPVDKKFRYSTFIRSAESESLTCEAISEPFLPLQTKDKNQD